MCPPCSTWLGITSTSKLLHREDEDDVVQSMYASFCIRQQRGSFELAGRDDLWKLLVTVTLRKARNAARRHRQRGSRLPPRARARSGDSNRSGLGLELLDASEPTPADAAAFNEELERRLRAWATRCCGGSPSASSKATRTKKSPASWTTAPSARSNASWRASGPSGLGATRRASDGSRSEPVASGEPIGDWPCRGGAGMSGEPDDDSSAIDLAADRFERAWNAGQAPSDRRLSGLARPARVARGSSRSCCTSSGNYELATVPSRTWTSIAAVSPTWSRSSIGTSRDRLDPLATEVYVGRRADDGR